MDLATLATVLQSALSTSCTVGRGWRWGVGSKVFTRGCRGVRATWRWRWELGGRPRRGALVGMTYANSLAGGVVGSLGNGSSGGRAGIVVTKNETLFAPVVCVWTWVKTQLQCHFEKTPRGSCMAWITSTGNLPVVTATAASSLITSCCSTGTGPRHYESLSAGRGHRFSKWCQFCIVWIYSTELLIYFRWLKQRRPVFSIYSGRPVPGIPQAGL